MATILPKGKRIKHIKLLVNWFESHRVLGPIQTAVAKYKAASKCKYVEPDVTVVVMGPKDLANHHAVDEATLLRLRQHAAIKRIQHAAKGLKIEDPRSFDSKMTTLREIRPDQIPAIESLTERLRTSWCTALAFERELDETVPQLHRALEEDRKRILTRASELMLASAQPWTQLPTVTQIAQEILSKNFRDLYGSLVHDLSSGEIARLIGECPIGWEKPGAANA